jgi:hypothetical protein
MPNHPNRKQFAIRFSTLERAALLEVLREAISRMEQTGRRPNLLHAVYQKLSDTDA